jgi:hypothetical protein
MGFGLHTLAHLAGDVAAPILKGAGAITGDKSLSNYGAAINNPNLVLSRPGNALPDNGGSAFSAVRSTAPATNTINVPRLQTTIGGGDTSAGGTGYGGSAYGSGGGAYGGAAAPDYLAQIMSGLANIHQSGVGAFAPVQSQLQGGAESLINKIKTGQGAIDRSKENNELNRMRGVQDILGYVRSGMRSGASTLAKMNALDSSAAEAIARAYNTQGNSQVRDVNNQSAMGLRDIQTQQDQLNLDRTSGANDLARYKDSAVATIANDVRTKLADLDQNAQGVGLTGKVAIDAEKQRVIDEGLSQLSAVDQFLSSGLGAINPEGQDQVIANANQLQSAGTSMANPFAPNLSQNDMNLSVQDPALTQLPLFTRAKKNQ